MSSLIGKLQGNFLYRNLANATSILGVLPVVLLFLDDGYRYLVPLIIFNNMMDDLDGVLAAKLDIRSRFGADLDNVCDAVAHVALALAVGAHFGGMVPMLSTVAAGSIILRVACRLEPERATGGGSPTNELMRHLLFAVLLAQMLGFDPEPVLIPVFMARRTPRRMVNRNHRTRIKVPMTCRVRESCPRCVALDWFPSVWSP